jgi:hypothetical protein
MGGCGRRNSSEDLKKTFSRMCGENMVSFVTAAHCLD